LRAIFIQKLNKQLFAEGTPFSPWLVWW